ncbi:MAG: hypothetical protein RE471_04075 [Ferroplasma sp.]|uniref:hypothetical protein n=1 Tax=Ferroplasma sp. TaxID=2591003 RepID=UPI0028168C3A|nr:hypothetical protein [Ferroplasma sp.]WMT52059.1 MAG: hypothetical protein RE471_04075 [Ferroplasma sp.]
MSLHPNIYKGRINDDAGAVELKIRESIKDSSLFFRFFTGKRILISFDFYRHNIEKNILERQINGSPDNYADFIYYAAAREYSMLIYTRKHRNNIKKPSRFQGILSSDKRRIRMATVFLLPAILKSFPLLFELSMNYYKNFSPDSDFASLFISKAGHIQVDSDTCRRFFIEVVRTAEPSGPWIRRMRSLSYELYGDSMDYMEVFALYIAYALYKKSGSNISRALRSAYCNSPLEICGIVMERQEEIEKYLWIQP